MATTTRRSTETVRDWNRWLTIEVALELVHALPENHATLKAAQLHLTHEQFACVPLEVRAYWAHTIGAPDPRPIGGYVLEESGRSVALNGFSDMVEWAVIALCPQVEFRKIASHIESAFHIARRVSAALPSERKPDDETR